MEVAGKPESQDFVAGGDYAPLFENAEPLPGDFVDTTGKIFGKHKGLPFFYTIGQQRGIGLSTGPMARQDQTESQAGPMRGLLSPRNRGRRLRGARGMIASPLFY